MILQAFIVAVTLAQFTVSANNRYLLKDGKPFFWMGDTGWELFHRLTLDEASQYLKRRAEQGFTVIQAVALAELDGLQTPNANGDKPLNNNDPNQPNEAYFKHLDNIIDKAADYNVNIGLLPTWGDKFHKESWGAGPEIFNSSNAKWYGQWIGNRYKNKTNIIWIMDGDRNPQNALDVAIFSAMAQGIMDTSSCCFIIISLLGLLQLPCLNSISVIQIPMPNACQFLIL